MIWIMKYLNSSVNSGKKRNLPELIDALVFGLQIVEILDVKNLNLSEIKRF